MLNVPAPLVVEQCIRVPKLSSSKRILQSNDVPVLLPPSKRAETCGTPQRYKSSTRNRRHRAMQTHIPKLELYRRQSCATNSVHRQIAKQTKMESLSLHLVPTANQSTSLPSCCAHISCADQSFRPSVQERMVCLWSCVFVTIVSWSHLTDHE